MKKLSLFFFAVALLASTFQTRVACAGLASDLLIRDPAITQLLEDINYENIYDETPDSVIEKGDILYGMQLITSVYDNPDGEVPSLTYQGSTFTAIFVAEVADTPTVGTSFNLKPVAASVWTTLTGYTPDGDGSTLISVFSKDFTGQVENAIDPDANDFPGNDIKGSLATAVGTELWEFGYTGAGGTAKPGQELFSVKADDLDFANLDLTEESVTFRAALNVTYWHGGAPLGLVTYKSPGLPAAQLQLTGRVDGLAVGDFALKTDTESWLNAVPEPSTVAMLIGLAAMGAGGLIRRRRSK